MKLFIVPAMAALAFSLALSAQPLEPEAPLGSRIPIPPDAFPIDKTRTVLADFAHCAIKKFPTLAREMVLDGTKVAVDDKYKKVADPECLAQAVVGAYDMVQLRMSSESFRSAVADELVKSDLSDFEPAQIKLAAPLHHAAIDPADYVPKKRVSDRELQKWEQAKQRDSGEAWLSGVGECAVRTNPTAARNLLETKVNSEVELQALLALIPAFSGCIDRGRQLRTERAAIRGAVAVNYYRLAYARKLPQQEAAE